MDLNELIKQIYGDVIYIIDNNKIPEDQYGGQYPVTIVAYDLANSRLDSCRYDINLYFKNKLKEFIV